MDRAIISCQTLRDELTAALEECRLSLPVYWIPSGLHNMPKKLQAALQDQLNQIQCAGEVLCAFGSCGDSFCGVTTGNYDLILPRVDDCISLLIGSCAKRQHLPESFQTYFLTRGWLQGERNIWVEYTYTLEKYGLDLGRSLFQSLFGHYKKLGIVDTGCYSVEEIKGEVGKIAETLHLTPSVIPASNQYLKELLMGPYSSERFLRFPPHTTITAETLHPELYQSSQPYTG